ncbi:helix-turn-helix domain-containing protein [Acidovorax sp. LjRoot74]|uniref:helix-turn-helix domain-containing protein n=1 Tax=Acidovorax sp. LjRoot74 TaxID=3342337 RepID=UPI003ECF3453
MSKTSENIQSLRKAGMTQTEIAKQSGVPQCRISRWEKGDVPKAADDALKLADLARRMAITAPAGQGMAHA